jgi:hypothetical protein
MPRISLTRIQDYLKIGDNPQNTAEKGRALEDLICYLFEKIPGITVTKRDRLNVFASEEIDIAFWNTKDSDGLYFLPNIILVECKNWSDPLSSMHVNWFDSKLKRRAQTFGVLVAANGITGDSSEISSAHEIIRTSLAEGRQLVVITRREIETFSSTTQIVELIKEKLCELAVSGTLFL